MEKNVTEEETRDSKDLHKRYADHLKFLWEQYNKLMGIGLIASATTLGFLLQGIIFNKDIRTVIDNLGFPLNTNWLISAIFSAGAAVLMFISARWFSQVLMERQIYGPHLAASLYFKKILENESFMPFALEKKKFMGFIDRKKFLIRIGYINEYAKWLGIISLLFSWFSSFVFAWPLIESLTLIKP